MFQIGEDMMIYRDSIYISFNTKFINDKELKERLKQSGITVIHML